MKIYCLRLFYLALLVSISSAVYAANTAEEALRDLQTSWAVDNYQLEGKAQQEAFVKLLETADNYVSVFPNNAAILVWRGIINSSYAGVKGGLGALGYAKASKADLEKALEIDPEVLDGSAYTSLGTLYYKVPGWPLGFGNDKKAESLLKKALQINPDGIDPNYFYGDYLLENKRYAESLDFLKRAAKANDRPGRELADQGRREEIQGAMKKANEHL